MLAITTMDLEEMLNSNESMDKMQDTMKAIMEGHEAMESNLCCDDAG